jgi:hypothetical protein
MTKEDVLKTITYVIFEELMDLHIVNELGCFYNLNEFALSLRSKILGLSKELDEASRADYLGIQDKYIQIIKNHFKEVEEYVNV